MEWTLPIYEYQCQSCGHEFEELQKFNDDPLVDCPVCQRTELRKLISQTSFVLKGGGWYATDFKKQNGMSTSDQTEENTKSESSEASTSQTSENKETSTKSSDKKSAVTDS